MGQEGRGKVARFWHWLGTPFRAIITLTFPQVRSLFSIAMLCGIIALSVENWTYMGLAHHAIETGEAMNVFLGFLIERTRYNSGLQAWFLIILGLVVFGAEYFRARWGDKEFGAGRGPEPEPPQKQRRRDNGNTVQRRRDEDDPRVSGDSPEFDFSDR